MIFLVKLVKSSSSYFSKDVVQSLLKIFTSISRFITKTIKRSCCTCRCSSKKDKTRSLISIKTNSMKSTRTKKNKLKRFFLVKFLIKGGLNLLLHRGSLLCLHMKCSSRLFIRLSWRCMIKILWKNYYMIKISRIGRMPSSSKCLS